MYITEKFRLKFWLGIHILSWATLPILINISKNDLPPLFFTGISFLIASLFSFLTLVFQKKISSLFQKKGLKNIIISTFLIIVCIFSLRFIGGQKTSPGNMALIGQTKVIFALLFFGLLGLEKITKKRIITAIFVFIGTGFILWESFSKSINIGDFYILLSCFLMPIANFFQKKALQEVSSSIHLFLRSFLGGLFVLVLSFTLETTPEIYIIQKNSWLILINSILPLWISQIAFLKTVKKIDISEIMIITGINPAVTIIFAFVFLDLTPSHSQIIGFFIISIGLILGYIKKTTMKKKKIKIIKWLSKSTSLVIILFGLPFYFGYGNPLPFTNPKNTLLDNVWLSVFPIMFIGLGIGWKWEKIGGHLIIIPILLASIIGFILDREGLPGPMFIPMIIGIFYLIIGYKKTKK